MRFSTQMMYQQNMRGITNSQAEWMKYGEQMSTGKRVVTQGLPIFTGPVK